MRARFVSMRQALRSRNLLWLPRGPKTAAKRFAEGSQLCTLLNDARILMAGATAFVREAKGQAQQVASKTY